MKSITINGESFSVGDQIKVTQSIIEGDKERLQVFEGILIAKRGTGSSLNITVRKIGTNQIGIERIFPVFSPNIKSIEVSRKGHMGSKHSKLYYIREKSKRDIEKIFSRANKRNNEKRVSPRKKVIK